MGYTVKTELNHHTIEKFLDTGHPRTVGILLGALPNPAKLFESVCITKITVDGLPPGISLAVAKQP